MDLIQLRTEIKNLRSMLEDALSEANAFNKLGDYAQVEECGIRIEHISRQLKFRKKHLEDRVNFNMLIRDLNNRGILCEVVNRYAHEV